jgi:hypothetical protein
MLRKLAEVAHIKTVCCHAIVPTWLGNSDVPGSDASSHKFMFICQRQE